MPIVTVSVELSNGKKDIFYYPSNIVFNYLQEKDYYLKDFVKLAIESIDEAQKRVVEKYGYQCIGCYIIKNRLNRWNNEYDKNLVVSVKKINQL
ncbi:MAG: hypothetical protein ACTSWR_11350 [Candidatus Helarchaeota archaeon]